jgi:hypothetical protein
MANGCRAYVSTQVRFGKGKSPAFEDFVTAKSPVFDPETGCGTALARNGAKAESSPQK